MRRALILAVVLAVAACAPSKKQAESGSGGDELRIATTTDVVNYNPLIGNSGLRGLFYVDGRVTSHYNTGSDLFPQKDQKSYLVVNGRLGLQDANGHWSIEFWSQNLTNEKYAQVAFNSLYFAT